MAIETSAVHLAERWIAARQHLAADSTYDGLASFTATMNALSRELISELGTTNPAVYEALAELAMNASTLTTRDARLIVNGRDRTQD